MIQKRLFALCTLLMLLCASGAQAQYGASRGYRKPQNAQEKPRQEYFGSINFFPLADFDIGGTFASGSGTQALLGFLTDFEVGTVDRGKDKSNYVEYSIGGWYWGRSGNDLYEVHGRVLSKRGLGLQFGYLNTVQGFVAKAGTGNNGIKTDAEAYDLFFIYNLSNTSIDHSDTVSSRRAWNIEFGLGLYIDASLHFFPATGNVAAFTSRNATANYTFYVSAAYQLSGNLYLNASNWTIRDRFQDLNRLSVGLGYHF